MKGGVFLSMVFLLVAIPLASSWGQCSEKSLLFLSLLKEGKYQEAHQMQDEKMQKLLPQATLQKMWEDMKKDLGALLSFETRTTNRKDGYLVTAILCRFERMTLLAQVALDERERIAGLYFLPSTEKEYVPPSYVDQNRFTEKEIVFGTPGWELPGTLTIPREKGPFPVLLLVHGSGPNDRDETIMGNKPFKDLAWGLATQGIAVFRYDKRTYTHGTKLSMSPELLQLTVEEEVIADALSALQLLRKQPEIDGEQIFLLGHSLGGYLAPEIARRDGKLRGIILYAAPARALHQLIPEQMEYLFSLDGHPDTEELQKLEVARKAVEGINRRTFAATDIIPALGGYASYFYSLLDLNPTESARQLTLPILVIQGGRDYQVSKSDFTLWQEALANHPEVSFRCYPDLNHLLFPGIGPSTPKEYEQPNHVDEQLLKDIASWIKKHTVTAK